jgi:hypothetical protein
VDEHRVLPDLNLREYLILAPILAGILFIGIFPKPLLSRIEPAARATCTDVFIRVNGVVFTAGGSRGLTSDQVVELQNRCAAGLKGVVGSP